MTSLNNNSIRSTKQRIKHTINFIVLFLVIGSSQTFAGSIDENLIDAKWLQAHLNDPNLVILDTTVLVVPDGKGNYISKNARSAYLAEHIPHARYADLVNNLSAKAPESYPNATFLMPSIAKFSEQMGLLGVDKNSHVVLYSNNQQVWPARLWWMLHWAGFDNVSLLDGGMKAWQANGGEVTTKITPYSPVLFSTDLHSRYIATKKEVQSAIDNKNVHIVDALSSAHFSGKFAMYKRKGHITSAVNLPSSNLINEAGKYSSLDEIDMMVDINKNVRVIVYCGGGVAASSVAFTLYRMGFKDVSVYMGSLQEWTRDVNNPMTF